MKITKYILLASLALSSASCELLQPDDIINPNVDENTFLQTPNAMFTWVNGANRSFATIIGSYVELTEILSDNYFNNYSESSKVFDFPTILYTDLDVTNLQRYVGTLPMLPRQMPSVSTFTTSKVSPFCWQASIS